MPRPVSNWRGVFRLIDIGNSSARRNVIPSFLRSIVHGGLSRIGRCVGRLPLGTRTLRDWAPVVFARLKEFGPYALMELLLPGGSVLALTVWLYRRRRKLA